MGYNDELYNQVTENATQLDGCRRPVQIQFDEINIRYDQIANTLIGLQTVGVDDENITYNQSIQNITVTPEHPTIKNYGLAKNRIPKHVAVGLRTKTRRAYRWTPTDPFTEYIGISINAYEADEQVTAYYSGKLNTNQKGFETNKNVYVDSDGSLTQTPTGLWMKIGLARNNGEIIVSPPAGFTAATFATVKLADLDYSNLLTLKWNEDDTADRVFNYKVNGGDRTLNLFENLNVLNGSDATFHYTTATTLTVEKRSYINQDLTTDSAVVQFEKLTIGDGTPDKQIMVYGDGTNQNVIKQIAYNSKWASFNVDDGASDYLGGFTVYNSGQIEWQAAKDGIGYHDFTVRNGGGTDVLALQIANDGVVKVDANNLDMDSHSIINVADLTATGTITGGTITDGTWSTTAGVFTGVASIDMTGDIDMNANDIIACDDIQVTSLSERVASSGISLLNDLVTDRWLSSDTNFFLGIQVVGAGNLAHTGGNEGYRHVAIGYQAMRAITMGEENVAIGYQALLDTTIGVQNVGIGYRSLYENIGGSVNIAIGSLGLRDNTSGNYNTAIGASSLLNNTSGDYNVGIASFSLGNNEGGDRNIAIGYQALQSETGQDADYNICMGYRAGREIIGDSNICIGDSAGILITSGLRNTLLGTFTGGNLTTADDCIVIGYNVSPASATADDQLNIGNAILGNLSTQLIELPGSLNVGTHDGSNALYINRYSAGIPYSYIVAGDSDRDVPVGILFQYRIADGSLANGMWLDASDGSFNLPNTLNVDTIGEYTSTDNVTIADGLIASENISVGTASPSASFKGTGDIYATSGIKAMEGLYAEAVAYGAGAEIQDNSLVVTYTNVAHGDATLTAATQIITDSHAAFDSTYLGQFLKVIGATPDYTGATGEIIAVLSGTTIRVSFGTAGGDTIVDATAMSFVIYPEPRMFVGDNGDTHFCIGVNEDASFKVCTDVSNNEHAVHFVSKAGVNGNAALEIEYDVNGNSDCSAIEVGYDATGFATADTVGTILDVIIDNVGATDGEIHSMDVALSDPTNTDMGVAAIGTHEGIDVIHQALGTPAAITKAYITDADGSINETSIAFVDSDPDTITDSGDGFVAAGFIAGQVITVSGSTSNDGTYTIASVAVGTLTLEANDSLTAEAAGDSVTITSTFRDVTTALGAAGTDVELFSNDNDVLLIASADKWDETNVILDTDANRNIRPDYYYIEDDGDWVEFSPADDTNGFQQSATIRFSQDDLTTWGERTINEVVGAYGSTDYYWQKITRTRNNLATPPVEDTIKITALNANLGWDAVGRLAIRTYSQSGEPDTTDLPANKFCFWIDTDDSKLYLCYNQSGTIKTTEMT